MKKKTDPKVEAINRAIELACREVQRCRLACFKNGSPIRSITFRVLNNGDTRTHITYRRKKTTK